MLTTLVMNCYVRYKSGIRNLDRINENFRYLNICEINCVRRKCSWMTKTRMEIYDFSLFISINLLAPKTRDSLPKFVLFLCNLTRQHFTSIAPLTFPFIIQSLSFYYNTTTYGKSVHRSTCIFPTPNILRK